MWFQTSPMQKSCRKRLDVSGILWRASRHLLGSLSNADRLIQSSGRKPCLPKGFYFSPLALGVLGVGFEVLGVAVSLADKTSTHLPCRGTGTWPRRRSPSNRRKRSPSRRKRSPSRRKKSPSRRKKSPSRRKKSPSRRKRSPSRRKKSNSRRMKHLGLSSSNVGVDPFSQAAVKKRWWPVLFWVIEGSTPTFVHMVQKHLFGRCWAMPSMNT